MSTAQDIVGFMARNKIEIRGKDDWKWNWHLAVPIFFFLVGLFNKEKKELFYKNYFTTLGRTIYVPDLALFEENIVFYESVIHHEHQHMVDIPGWYERISYLVSKERRLWFETRGYFWNVYFEIKQRGKVDKYMVENIVTQLSGNMYNNMTSEENAYKIVLKMILDAKKENFPK